MTPEQKNIEKIEAYLSDELSAEEQKAFEERLQADAALQAEVTAYRSLFQGFEGLQADAFQANMTKWESSWADTADGDTDLIEWYLKGELGATAQQKVEYRMQKEEGFAKKVKDYQKLLEGFGALGSEAFSDKMKSWEAKKVEEPVDQRPQTPKVRRLQPIFVRLAAAAVILLLIGVGLQQYMKPQFSNETLMADFYTETVPGNLMNPDAPLDSNQLAKQFDAIHRLLANKAFEQAIPQMPTLLSKVRENIEDQVTRKYMQENLEWNYALALLGANRDDQQVLDALNPIIENATHEYHDKALKLRSKLNSIWR